MLVAGIIVTIVAVLMTIFPQIFMKLKSPISSQKASTNPKMNTIVRIWGGICVVIGIILIIVALV